MEGNELKPNLITQVLTGAKNEIVYLRRRNEIMSAKLEVFDSMMMLLKARIVEQGCAHSPDICHDIDQMINSYK